MNNINTAIRVLQSIFKIEANKWCESKSYPTLKRLEKQTTQIFVWLIIPEEFRADYLIYFTDYQLHLISLYGNSDEIIEVKKLVRNASIDLPILYQIIINLEFSIHDNEIAYSVNKSNRDNYGAYYTPEELANDMVQRTGKYAIDINHKVIDLSCGSGIFLIAYAKYIVSEMKLSEMQKSQLTQNLYGVDVDPIALLIAAYEISKITGYIPNHLTIGNPLLICNSSSKQIRQELFFDDMIYDIKMGLPNDFYNFQYDLILGNPPWEKVRFEERKFFDSSAPQIAQISLSRERAKCINALKEEDILLFNYYKKMKESYSSFKSNVRDHKCLETSLYGELNTYSMFTELAIEMLAASGISVLIVKASLIKTSSNSKLINKLNKLGIIDEIQIFSNRKKIFSIDSREEFCVIYIVKNRNNNIKVKTDIDSVYQIDNATQVNIKITDLYKVNPTSGLFPNFKTANELAFLVDMYSAHPTFSEVYRDVNFGRLVHLTNHSENIYREYSDDRIAIYEGKFIEQYDTRYATFDGVDYERIYKNKASAYKQSCDICSKQIPKSRFFVDKKFWSRLSKNYNEEYMLAWRSLTSVTNKRTMISCILPFMPTSQSIQFLQTSGIQDLIILNGLFNSMVFDYLVRFKMPGIDLTQSVIKDIPVPAKHEYNEILKCGRTLGECVIDLVSSLYAYENRLAPLFTNSKINNSNRKAMIAEIDRLFAKAYKINECELKSIAKTFKSFYSEEEINLYF